jgi:hypothetical protein
MIDTLSQEGTDKALDDIVQRPQPLQPTKPGLWSGFGSSPFRGIGGGAAEMIGSTAELLGAYGQVEASMGLNNVRGQFALPTDAERKAQEAARQKMLTKGLDFSNEAGDLFRARAKEIMPDPQTTGAAAQVTAGLTSFATKAIGYSLTTGPAAPVMLGTDAGLTEADKLKQEGVDLETRTKAGVVAGTVAGASIVLPVGGSTALKTAGLVGLAGPGGFVAQNATERAILANAGYDKISSQYDPFDPVGLTLATLVPAGFGAVHLAGAGRAGRGEPAANIGGGLKTEADVKAGVQLTPAEQARSDAFERSAGNLAELQAEIARQKNPEAKAILQAELERQTAAAHAHGDVAAEVANNPDLVPAARVQQVARVLDESRLTPDQDLGGMSAHQDAIERAQDQINAGERVDVTEVLGDRALDAQRVAAMRDRVNDTSALRPPADDEHIAKLAPEQQGVMHDLYAQAAREKGGFDAALSAIAEDVGGKPMLASLKKPQKAVGKILEDYGGDASKIKDLLRGTVAVDSIEGAQQAVAQIFRNFDVLPSGRRNLFDPNTKPIDGYRDAKFNVRVNGHVAEIQVGIPEMLAVKDGEGHKLYDQRQDLERATAGRQRTAAEQAQIDDLNARQRALYEPAWEAAKTRLNSASSTGAPLARAEAGLNTRGSDLSQAVAEKGEPGTLPSETGIPSTSNSSTDAGNLAGRTEAAGSRFIGTSDESLHLDALGKQADSVLETTPDLMIQLDGMDAPVRAADLLAQLRDEAAAETRDASLVEVAANCFLRS